MTQPLLRYDPTRAVFEMPLGITVVERRYLPQQSSHELAFRQDTAYFKARNNRWLAIRKALPGEVDSGDALVMLDGEISPPPTAWMRVTRHPTLGFTAVIVWRGSLAGISVDSQGYMELESDEAVDFVLQTMRNNGCANWPEVDDYLGKLALCKAIYSAQHTQAYNKAN